MPASLPSCARTSFVFFVEFIAYCCASTYSRTGARSVSPSLQMPPPMQRMSGWKMLIMSVRPTERYLMYSSTIALPTGSPARIASKAVLPLTLLMSPPTSVHTGESFGAFCMWFFVVLIRPVAEP